MGRNRFFVYSKRLKREVRLYNTLQYDHWALIETDFSIEDYCERPLQVVVSVAGEVTETTFDMWIRKRDSEEFIFVSSSHEIDSNDKRANPKRIREMNAQLIWCTEHNKNHRIVTDEDLKESPILLANKKSLVPFCIPFSDLKNDTFYSIVNLLKTTPLSIRQIENELSHSKSIASIRNLIYSMILHEILKVDLSDKLLSSFTEVTLNVEKAYR
ncbi:hypothetical protein [Cohnella sp. JJ-181]|uniref:hypothetical protein n=1 Tax=Cohnella rhizoplanae TaxID=2974897 RepID=UPI0022FF9DCF|nr:hypothetical protein [Cohnella sp. JJ-181]CAI6087637.1 hypothetical protein COHCIP112018_05625 [Cohnella sp. JJ-181]